MNTWKKKGKKVLVGMLIILSFIIGGVGVSTQTAEAAPVYASEHTIVEIEKPEYVLKNVKFIKNKRGENQNSHNLNPIKKETTEEMTPVDDETKVLDEGSQSLPKDNKDAKKEKEQIEIKKSNSSQKDVKETTETPVHHVVEVKETEIEKPQTPVAIQELDQSILQKSGTDYTYTVDGIAVLIVKTDGTSIKSITFDGVLYYVYDYANETLLINEYGEEEGKQVYKEYKQAMRSMEKALQQATIAAGGGYKEVLLGGQKGSFTKTY